MRTEATGDVIRDSLGKFMAANNRKVCPALDATTTEALAVWHYVMELH